MESKIAELKKGKMEYTLRGEGPVILNLHGGHSNSQETFGYQPLLSAVSFEHAEYAAANIKGAEIYADDFWGHLIWIGSGREKRNKKLLEFLD